MEKKFLNELPTMYELYSQKGNVLMQAVKGMTLQDVKEDSIYAKTVERIKSQVLLNVVTFGDPKIVGYVEKTKHTPNGEMFGEIFNNWKGYAVTVEYPIEGSGEIFSYYANGFSYGSSHPFVYLPSGSTVKVEVDSTALDKERIITQATQQMENTFVLIRANNPDIQKWSASQDIEIQAICDKQRKILLNLFN